ncbi:MAG: TFIIB-type zinc ribbon-containing protein [Anaerolineales bacterium]|nr:TFIIB-type zinc ribbon-containing protein [Anaerolineales bacterium]MCB8962799.1 TFIIB-type zinc ribbon-containing protein [Ardenticatenales bacterium]
MQSQFPPSDYVQTESAVRGITVFKPRPQEETNLDTVVRFVCPNCNSHTAFQAEDGGVTCSYCGYHEAPEKEVVGKGAEEFEFTVSTVEQASHGWGLERIELVCRNCNARTVLPPDKLTATCPFCNNNQVIQAKASQDVLRPRFLIPLKITDEQAHARVREWLGTSWMTPSSLQKLASVTEYTPIYLPYWTFDARNIATWKAQVGHTKTETYWVNGQRRTRTKTVWRWENGRVNHFYDDALVSGTQQISSVLVHNAQNFDTEALVPYDPAFLAGISAQAYEVDLQKAYDTGRERMRAQTKQFCMDQASTSNIRNFSMTLDFSEESWRYVLLPFYIATYNFQNQAFQLVVNGQTGQVAGQRPVDWTKVWLAMIAMVTPGILLGIIALITLAFGIGIPIGFLAMFALSIGGSYALKTYRTADAMDDV